MKNTTATSDLFSTVNLHVYAGLRIMINKSYKYLVIVFAGAFISCICAAQSAQPAVIEDFKPSILNQPGQEYPQVNSQGYARFKIAAKDAKAVSVSLGLGGSGGTKLTQGADGMWTGTTTGPLDEGFHYYHLSVDGGTFN